MKIVKSKTAWGCGNKKIWSKVISRCIDHETKGTKKAWIEKWQIMMPNFQPTKIRVTVIVESLPSKK